MNRRGFLKTLLGASIAAALPGCKYPAGPTESVAIDLAKPGSEHTAFLNGEFGRYEGVRFIESTPEGGNVFYSKALNPKSWNDPDWKIFDWHTDQFAKKSVYHAPVSREKVRQAEQDLMNHIESVINYIKPMGQV